MRASTILLTLVLTASAAQAGPDAELKKHEDAGKAAFAAERYADAIAEFRAANDLKPDPKYVYSIAQAQRMAGDCAGAIESYQAFLATKPDAKLADYSKANIDRCKEELAKNPKPAPVEPAPTPTPAEPAITPSEPTPTPITGPVDTGDGARPWYRDWVGNAMVIGGVASAAVGTTVFLSGRSAANKVNNADDYTSFQDAQDAASSALTKQRIGIGAAIVGAGLIVGGILHYKMSGGGHEVRVTAVPTVGGAAVFAGVDL